MAYIRIGLSGYSYKPWQGPKRFYPSELKQSEFLEYYATRYGTVELDGLWYRLPTLSSVTKWIDQTPEHFVFSAKAHRMITHLKRLRPEAVPSSTPCWTISPPWPQRENWDRSFFSYLPISNGTMTG